MKTICIIISVLVAVAAIYCWMKLRRWNISFDSCVKTDADEPIKRQPARDAKGRFTKKQQ